MLLGVHLEYVVEPPCGFVQEKVGGLLVHLPELLLRLELLVEGSQALARERMVMDGAHHRLETYEHYARVT